MMNTWKYKTVYIGTNEVDLRGMSDYLNKEGLNGWELVTIIPDTFIDSHAFSCFNYIFKKKINE